MGDEIGKNALDYPDAFFLGLTYSPNRKDPGKKFYRNPELFSEKSGGKFFHDSD
jgi:hypothetical protein